jgi:CubicO group peptidase (beta-lactamase class C family)
VITEPALESRIADVGAAELERWGTPGLELIAIKDREVVFCGGFGRRSLDPDQPVTPDTVFAHGSTGKAFTAYLVSKVVEEGLLAWDTPVREYIPELRLADPVVAERVTLRDLLSHRSGLARHDLAWIANPSWSRRDLVARLRHLPLAHDLRQAWQYSNFGFVVAGHAVEAVTGSTYEEQLRQRIFEPLGLERSYARTAEMQAQEDHARPYRIKGGRAVAIPQRSLDSASPAGGVMSCARDTAKWLLLQLDGGETQQLQMPMPGGNDDDVVINGYAMGWCVGTYRGRKLVWHNGGVDGFYTEFLLLPDDGIAVGTCNNAGQLISQAVAREVADLLLGVEPKGWGAVVKDQVDKAEAQAGQGAQPIAGTSPAHPLEEYAGTFVHPGYGDLAFELRDGGLAARLGETELQTAHRHFDTWSLTLATLGETSIPATFFTDASGKVAEVLVPAEPGQEPVRFRRQKAS